MPVKRHGPQVCILVRVGEAALVLHSDMLARASGPSAPNGSDSFDLKEESS
jgi:hypothetical protein